MMSCSHLHKLVLDPPGLGPHVEPDEDVGECLQEQVPQFLCINTPRKQRKDRTTCGQVSQLQWDNVIKPHESSSSGSLIITPKTKGKAVVVDVKNGGILPGRRGMRLGKAWG